MGRRSSALATVPRVGLSSIPILPPPPEDTETLESMLSALHQATASLDVKLARWHESVYQSLEDGDQEPWPDDLPLPAFTPLQPAVSLSRPPTTPAPRASGTRKRKKARPAQK